MPSDILPRVVETARDVAGEDGWCSRAQMGATTIDKREVDRALRVGVAEGQLERDGRRYRLAEADRTTCSERSTYSRLPNLLTCTEIHHGCPPTAWLLSTRLLLSARNKTTEISRFDRAYM